METWNSGDLEAFLSELPLDFEFAPDPSFPDAGTYRGDEVRRWMEGWVETWRDNRLEALKVVEQDPTVRLESRWHLAAPQGGGEIPVSDFDVVFWFDPDDRAVRMAAFFDRDQALEAVRGPTG